MSYDFVSGASKDTIEFKVKSKYKDLLSHLDMKTLEFDEREKYLKLVEKEIVNFLKNELGGKQAVVEFKQKLNGGKIKKAVPNYFKKSGLTPVKGVLEKALHLLDDYDNILPDGTSFYVDGYHFGDTMLEDVMFRCQLTEKGTVLTVFGPDDPSILCGLDEDQWMRRCYDFVQCEDFVYNNDAGDLEYCLQEAT